MKDETKGLTVKDSMLDPLREEEEIIDEGEFRLDPDEGTHWREGLDMRVQV